MSLTKKIIIWFIGAALFLGMLTYTHYHLEKIGVAKILLAFAGLVGVLITIVVNHKKKVDYSKINIIETAPKTVAKEILPQLSAEEIEKRQKVTQQEARAILGAMNEWQVEEIRSMHLYVKKHNYDPSMPLSPYKSTNAAEYELLKDKLIQRNAVKHIGNQLLDFTSLGYSICELALNKELRQK